MDPKLESLNNYWHCCHRLPVQDYYSLSSSNLTCCWCCHDFYYLDYYDDADGDYDENDDGVHGSYFYCDDDDCGDDGGDVADDYDGDGDDASIGR